MENRKETPQDVTEIRRHGAATAPRRFVRFWQALALCAVLVIAIAARIALKESNNGFSEGVLRGKISRVRADQRSIATSLEAYWIDWETYPVSTTGSLSINGFTAPEAAAHSYPTFNCYGVMSKERPDATGVYQGSLTTPISYLTGYMADPFGTPPGVMYGYYSTADPQGWILVSPGPDRDYDIAPDKDYDPKLERPAEGLSSKTFDPTNGLDSSGDIFRVKY